jgi:hypothetical protein
VLSLLGMMLIVAAFTELAAVQRRTIVTISASNIFDLLIEG